MSQILKDDDRSTVIKDGNYVVKVFKNLSKKENKVLRQKLEMSDKFSSIEQLIRPISFSMNESKVKEVYYPYVDGISFVDYYNKHELNLNLSIITQYIYDLEQLVKQGHEYNIVFPDMLTEGNILYNPSTKKVYALDYDGLQIENLPCNGVSDFIYKPHSMSLLHSPKYYKKGLYTKNIDIYSIYIAYIYYTTKYNLAKDPDLKRNIEEYLTTANIYDTDISKKIMEIFNLKVDNKYLDQDLYCVENTYKLSLNIPGKPRRFIAR